MGVTVDTLLKLPIMQTHCKCLNDTGLNNIVQYVTVTEASNIRFPNLGEHIFVLSTLSAHHDSLEDVNNMIRGLCNVNVSAIGIKLGRFIDEIDPSTIQIASEHQVALIALSPNIYFREILSETLSVITGNQRQTLKQINNVNQSLMGALLQNRSIQDLLNILCEELDCYCCCIDPSGKKIAQSTSLKEVFDTEQVQQSIDYFLGNPPAHSEPYYRSENTFIFPCIVQETLSAAFCIVVFEPALDVVVPLAQAIVNSISIKYLEQNLEVQAQRGIVSAALDDILFSNRANHELVSERLELLDFVIRKNFIIILLSRPVTDQKRSWFYTVDSIQRVFSPEFPSAVAFKRGSEYILLASYDSDTITKRLKSIMERCQRTLSDSEGEQFDISCSTVITDLSKMPECYLQAKKALQFGRMLNQDQHAYLYHDYFELGLISYGVGSSEANMFFERIINPILEYDKQFKTDLWNTLACSFANEKLEQIANSLHIHISTLRYRLQKVENLTGYSYFTPHDRLTLYLAFLLYKASSDTNP